MGSVPAAVVMAERGFLARFAVAVLSMVEG